MFYDFSDCAGYKHIHHSAVAGSSLNNNFDDLKEEIEKLNKRIDELENNCSRCSMIKQLKK